jgi:hypothetical protein
MLRCLPDGELLGSPSRTIRQRGGEDSGCNSIDCNGTSRRVLELFAHRMDANHPSSRILGIASDAA